jgi:exopolyphosphatase / guanosine-5'-triphosphate,3'-diphosphate pyrophosphatase
MPAHERLVAAVDLGSNSFRLLIGRVVKTPAGTQVYPLDSLKETVRLASGLTREKTLDGESRLRGLAVLERFGDRLRSFSPHDVRAVATNTLRVAKNARAFLEEAEAALGFPIEVIAGREEARLIYTGVANTASLKPGSTLVIDIGGGSTELIIGEGHEPRLMESLFMGCVSYSLRFFPGGEIDKQNLKQAELAAQKEIEVIARDFLDAGWQHAIGSSGTARALGELLEQNGLSNEGITRDGLAALRELLLKAGHAERLKLEALKPDRIPVLPGGFAIMSAIFKMLDLESLEVTDAALRQGVLYDLLGRSEHHDMRDITIAQFTHRYSVDRAQAKRVTALALALMRPLMTPAEDGNESDIERRLQWAATLHEIGLSIAHAGYHKHSAYILAAADMPGFSKMDQAKVAAIVLGHTGKLSKVADTIEGPDEWLAVLCLRIAALVHRRRTELDVSKLALRRNPSGYTLEADADWLVEHPLTEFNMRQESAEWAKIGISLELEQSVSRR